MPSDASYTECMATMVRRIVVLLTLATFGRAAVAQTTDDLNVLEPGVGDIGSLSTSLRYVERGLNQPTAFDQVFAVPGSTGLRMRADGALYAVFRDASYAATANGVQPIIPNDTVFFIGEPDPAYLRQWFGRGFFDTNEAEDMRVSPAFANRVDMRLDNRWSDVSVAPAPEGPARASADRPERFAASRSLPRVDPSSDTVTVVSDGLYRAARIRHLMAQAAAVTSVTDDDQGDADG